MGVLVKNIALLRFEFNDENNIITIPFSGIAEMK